MSEEKVLTFDKYFNKSEEELLGNNRELILKKVKRGFESTIDQLEGEKLKLEMNIEEVRIDIANGDTNSIIKLGQMLVEMNDLGQLIVRLSRERGDFVG